MRPTSFRFKLLGSMLLVVAGVTVAILWLAQTRFEESYRSVYARLFENQNRAFAREQSIFFQNIKEVCAQLAASRRIQLAIEESEGPILYQRVSGELETRNLRPGRGQTTFVAVLDQKLRFIPPPAELAPELRPFETQPSLQAQFVRAGRRLEKLDEPIAGYATPSRIDGKVVLQRAVFTKVVDTSSGDVVGAIILGFPLPEFVDNSASNLLKTGVLFDGQLFSRSIPETDQARLAARVRQLLSASKPALDRQVEQVSGEPHQLFFEQLQASSGPASATLVALISLREALQTKRALRQTILICGCLGLAVALALSGVLSHNLAVPIRELVRGTGEIQRGNFQVKVPVRSNDEIGQLTNSFNEMAEGLALKEKYRSVLNMVTDKNVAQQLIQGGVTLGGEMREVSVLFCDIRGFTPLTQNMPPAEVIRMLNEHFTPLTQVVQEHGGVVDKFVGDLIMAIFGAPSSYGNDARNAAGAALAMIQQRQRLNQQSRYTIQIGIGIASGAAVAGCMGSKDRLNYTVLGERVNLASRLCGKAGKMEIIIDETTCERLGNQFIVEPLGVLELKGFSGKTTAFKLVAPAP